MDIMQMSKFIKYSNPRPVTYNSMRFREKVAQSLKERNFPFETTILVKTGGLGDLIQLTPVAKALKAKEPKQPVVAIIDHSTSIFDNHPYIDLTIECKYMPLRQVVKSVIGLVENVFDLCYVSCAYGSWSNSAYFYENMWHYTNFPYSICRIEELKKHVCDVMLYSLGLEQFANCNDLLVIPDSVLEPINGDYVIVCNSPGNFEECKLKQWPKEDWQKLIMWLHSKRIIPVQLGVATDELIHTDVMDLRGKTSPRQAAGYLQCSRGYIGIEGGIFHLSKAVGVPAVVIFNATPVISYAYPDTLVVTNSQCKSCIWGELWFKAKCKYGYKYCINSPSWQAVANQVEKMLKRDE